jgi:hypothetical protein
MNKSTHYLKNKDINYIFEVICCHISLKILERILLKNKINVYF